MDLYEKYPQYKELVNVFNNTPEGRDLYAILLKTEDNELGYKLTTTGRFNIGVGSKSFIQKEEGKKWYFTALSDGRRFSEAYYDTATELCSGVWKKTLCKRTPHGVKRTDFEKWLNDPNCSVIGKEYSIDEITSAYLYEMEEGFIIKSADSIFNSTRWEKVFKFFGTKKRMVKDGLYRPLFSMGPLIPYDETSPYFGFWKKFFQTYHNISDENLSRELKTEIFIKSVPKKEMSINHNFITIGACNQEEAEKRIVSGIISMIRNGIIYSGKEYKVYNNWATTEFMIALLENDMETIDIKILNEFILQNPTTILSLPDDLQKRVMEETGITQENVETIRYANQFKLI